MRESNKFEELKQTISLTVKTKCPDKYLLIDRETGQTYVGNQMGVWDRLEPVIRNS